MFCYIIFLIPVLIGPIIGQEHHCSKFHYEEKLLEKMIRMEMHLEEMQRKLNMLEQKAEDSDVLQNQPAKGTVAFFATANSRKTYGADETLVFENVVTNLGEAYNPANGIFTTPSTGMFVFFSTVLGSNDVELWNYISVNNKAVANFNSHGTGGRHDSGTVTTVLQLSKGDEVSIKNSQSSGNTYGENYTHFGGFRLVN
ncbi:complement C1q-like protein 3 [Mercenaria mercenaria]|uniref:complement C1q-like protein 3 n=1 Tax=Mercenaria mercenaria TaxID=6596 RepID=UPI00234FAFE2|nr:complement C1q-like protein 3 [Mercenaria mercenaria]